MWRLRRTPVDAEGQSVPPAEGSAWTQEAVRGWLRDVHGVSCSSGAFSEWERWYPVSQRLTGAKHYALDIKELLRSRDPDLEIEQLDRYGDLAFRKMAFDLDDAELFAEMRKLTLKERTVRQRDVQLEQDARRIALLEEKARFADEVKKAAANREGGLTAEDMEEIERRLKLM